MIEGKAEKPVYVWIDDESIEIRDARHIWGKTTWETDKIIKEEIGDPNIYIAYIGPAGENLVNISTILSKLNRSGARGGAAAVMGSKKLKAIAVRGTGGVQVAQPDKFEEAFKEIWEQLDIDKSIDVWTKPWGIYGSPSVLRTIFELAGLGPNVQDEWCHFVDDVSGELLLEKYVVKPKACSCCFLPACGHWVEVKEGPYAGTAVEGIQAGTIMNLGCMTGVNHLPAIIKAHALCNELGVDLCAGTAIAWAMEAYEKGVITKEDTDGIELRFGNYEAMLEMIRKIAYREGFGDILANGVKKASEIVGKGSERFALHEKGVDMSAVAYLRSFYIAALGQAVNDMGSDHTRFYPPYPVNPAAIPLQVLKELPYNLMKAFDRFSPDDKGHVVKWLYDTRAVLDSLPYCVFTSRAMVHTVYRVFAKPLTAATGVEFTYKDLMLIGERICNLERAFNVRQGVRRKDDTLPRRYLEEPVQYGGSIGAVVQLEPMLDDYYEARGWDKKTGIPTRKKLEEVGLKEVAEELEKLGGVSKHANCSY